MTQKAFNLIAGFIFGIVALVHLLRLGQNWGIVIGTWSVPMWISWIGLFVAGILSYFAFRFANRGS